MSNDRRVLADLLDAALVALADNARTARRISALASVLDRKGVASRAEVDEAAGDLERIEGLRARLLEDRRRIADE